MNTTLPIKENASSLEERDPADVQRQQQKWIPSLKLPNVNATQNTAL